MLFTFLASAIISFAFTARGQEEDALDANIDAETASIGDHLQEVEDHGDRTDGADIGTAGETDSTPSHEYRGDSHSNPYSSNESSSNSYTQPESREEVPVEASSSGSESDSPERVTHAKKNISKLKSDLKKVHNDVVAGRGPQFEDGTRAAKDDERSSTPFC